jgi:hypothetical protein
LNQGSHFFEKYSDLRNIHTYLNMDKKSEMPFNPYIGAQKLLITQHCNKNPLSKTTKFERKFEAIYKFLTHAQNRKL